MYELVSYQMCPGGPAVWGQDFQAAVTAHDAPGYAKLVGAFHSEFGQLNRGKAPPEHRGTLKICENTPNLLSVCVISSRPLVV